MIPYLRVMTMILSAVNFLYDFAMTPECRKV
jgi:hypothetical protein